MDSFRMARRPKTVESPGAMATSPKSRYHGQQMPKKGGLLRSHVLVVLCGAVTLIAAETPKVDFARDIRPIFQERCYSCHGPSQEMAGLRLDRRSSAFQI